MRAQGAEVWAICRDASAGGALLSARTPIPIGETVAARFRVRREEPDEREVAAKVVWIESAEDEMSLAFPFRVALEFTEPMEAIVAELEALEASARQG